MSTALYVYKRLRLSGAIQGVHHADEKAAACFLVSCDAPTMAPGNLTAIRANIFEHAYGSICSWEDFPWHRSPYHPDPDADQLHSSQAFCISVWGTCAAPGAATVRQVIAEMIGAEELLCASNEPWSVRLEYGDGELLNEKGRGIPTQLDAVAEIPASVTVVESKLSEPLGQCYHANKGYCSGTYGVGSDRKTGSQELCRLDIQEERRQPREYWAVMKMLARPGAYAPPRPCPFAGSGNQVMRVIGSAYRMAEVRNRPLWRAVFAYSGSVSPETTAVIDAVCADLLPENQDRIRHLDYDELAGRLSQSQDPIASGLGAHMQVRLQAAREIADG